MHSKATQRKKYAIWCVSNESSGCEGWLSERRSRKILTFETRRDAERDMRHREEEAREWHVELYIKEFPDQFAIWCVREGAFGGDHTYWLKDEQDQIRSFSTFEDAQAVARKLPSILRLGGGLMEVMSMMAGHASYYVKTHPDVSSDSPAYHRLFRD